MSGRITVPAASVIPQGVGAPPPPGLDPKKGKLMCIKVRMLDDTVGVFHLGHKALGQALFEEVCRHLNLLECDYFGLEFLDSVGNRCWLDKDKSILRQITAARSDARFYFVVKFYPPNPADLEEEYTRYLFALQVKRDLASGQFVVNENTAALMASYIVQSECGDYCVEDYPDHTYLSSVRFIPNQSADFEKKVMENHKKIFGTSPAESDLALLETARRVEFYGVKFHPAKDIEGTAVNLAVLHLGLKVYHQLTCANTFSWAKIRKLSFKRRKFLIKLHPESYAYYKDTIEFLFENRNECKMFWKKCIEHHAFFRCSEINRLNKQQSKLFSRGSSFRYSGRTQKQLIDYIREHHRRREPFTRPIHSSFNRHYFNDRPLPTPLIPVANQNGDGPLHMGTAVEMMIEDGVLVQQHEEDGDLDSPQRSTDRDGKPWSGRVLHDDHGGGSQDRPPTPEAPQLRRKAKDSSLERETLSTFKPIPSGTDFPTAVQIENVRMQSLESARSPLVAGDSSFANISANNNDSLPHHYHQLQQGELSEDEFPPPAKSLINYSSGPKAARPSARSQLSRGDSGATSTSQSEKDIPFRINVSADSTVATAVLDAHSARKKKYLSNKTYCIAKELLATERTYRRDMTIICVNYKSLVQHIESVPKLIFDEFFGSIDPIYEFEETFFTELEQRFSSWESKHSSVSTSQHVVDNLKVGDILLRAIHNSLQLYQVYLNNLASHLGAMDELYNKNKQYEAVCKEFEHQKLCYLPVNSILLKPLHRLLIRQGILTRLVSHYIDEGGHNPDLSECKVALDKISYFIVSNKAIKSLENFVKLIELERDLIGVQNLVQGNRTFLRQGSLQRFSKKGSVQRLFVLFDDCLLYANRHVGQSAARMAFKLHGQIPLRGLMLEDGDPFHLTSDLNHCFTIYGANRSLVVSANSAEEKQSWVEDISRAVMIAKESTANLPQFPTLTLKSSSSTDDVERPSAFDLTYSSGKGSFEDISGAQQASPSSTLERQQWHHRANDTLHVCWHRSTSLGVEECRRMTANQLSGYVLRKFRNSSGWQKLWVVYCDFCLFFYKSHQEEVPLASLPLLGYFISLPNVDDNIRKDFVFKLHYKSHYYFFRADSEFAFNRWLDVLQTSCTLYKDDSNL